MKRFLQIFFSFVMCSVLAGMAANAVHSHLGVAPGITATVFIACVALYTLIQTPLGDAAKSRFTPYMNAVQVEIWVNYIMERFWKDNMFLKYAYNDDQYVIGGQIVHINQRGSKPLVVKNRNSFPGTIVQRSDTDVTYSLDDYSTNPTQITNIDVVQIAYDKIASVIDDHLQTLNETVGDDMLIRWSQLLPAANIIYTTGASTAALETGQTGNRCAMIHQDLKKARQVMNKNNVPSAERYALLEENMYEQMVDSLSNTQYRDFSKVYDPNTGVVGNLYGFMIMTRSSVAMAATGLNGSNQLVVNALGTAASATDNVVSLCWQKDAVARALGSIDFFERLQDPEYYGDIYSAQIRVGGRVRRADSLGILAIVQGTPSGN